MAEQQSFVAGLSIPDRSGDAASLLQMARSDGYDFVTTNLPTPLSTAPQPHPPRKDVTSLESKWWSTSIVGMVADSPGLDAHAMETDKAGDAVPGAKLLAALSSTDAKMQKTAESHLRSMIHWASHMSIPAVILPPVPPSVPSNPHAPLNYARILSTVALECSAANVQLWVRTSLDNDAIEAFSLLHRRADGASNLGCLLVLDQVLEMAVSGTAMTAIHQTVGYNLKAVSFNTSVFLTNKRGYPTLSKGHQILFTEVLRRLGRTLRVLVEGQPMHHPPTQDSMGNTGCLAYLQYLRHLRARPEVASSLDTEEAVLESGYLDHLQSPLQPLGDNLEFNTYETFERDPVKYERYRQAIIYAVRDGITSHRFTPVAFGAGGEECIQVTILVVGAGRGPLIRAALAATAAVQENLPASTVSVTKKKIQTKVVAIEKNPSAILFLRSLQSREPSWNTPDSSVTVIECDMRYAAQHALVREMVEDPNKRADIVVSELLGSFGDNELSPECLDGAQRCGILKDDCVSIPQRYTSFLAPVSSMRLHSEARAQAYSPSNPTDGPGGQPYGMLRAMETPYVVRSHAASQTHVEKPCWEFVHPKTRHENSMNVEVVTKKAAEAVDNERHAHLVFPPDKTQGAGYGCGYGQFDSAVAAMAASPSTPAPTSSPSTTVHGFLGSFHATLYESRSQSGEVNSSSISIAPSSFSMGMFSWFPLYFPLRESLHVPAGAAVSCSMWRRTDSDERAQTGRVWYEWCADVVITDNSGAEKVLSSSPVHNPNGRSYHVRL